MRPDGTKFLAEQRNNLLHLSVGLICIWLKSTKGFKAESQRLSPDIRVEKAAGVRIVTRLSRIIVMIIKIDTYESASTYVLCHWHVMCYWAESACHHDTYALKNMGSMCLYFWTISLKMSSNFILRIFPNLFSRWESHLFLKQASTILKVESHLFCERG